MKPWTFMDTIKDWILRPYRSVRYYFAKSWLDDCFGEHDYWGEVIGELFVAQKKLDEQYKQIQDNLKETI